MIKRTFYRVLFLLFFCISIILAIIAITKSVSLQRFEYIYLIILFISIIFTIISWLLIESTFDEYERNNRKYVKKCFSFLLQKDYRLHIVSINGDSVYSFSINDIFFELDVESDRVDFVVRKGNYQPYTICYEDNIRNVLKQTNFDFLDSTMTTMEKIKALSEVVQKNYYDLVEILMKE